MKVVTPLSLPLVSLEMFFFEVVLHSDTYCPALKRERKTQPDLPVLSQGNIFFSLQIFHVFFRNLFCSLPSKNSSHLPVY